MVAQSLSSRIPKNQCTWQVSKWGVSAGQNTIFQMVGRKKIFKAPSPLHTGKLVLTYNLSKIGWSSVCGTSGTIKALEALAIELEYTHLNYTALKEIQDAMLSNEAEEHPLLRRISDSRRAVLAGGLCILTALFEAFNLDHIQWLSAALREGVLLEMLGRIGGEDIRHKSVLSLSNRFKVDQNQHERIMVTLQYFIDQVSEKWSLSVLDIQYLRWAVLLHEVGRTIAYSGYHKHSAYIVEHADLPGFSRREQQLLSMLIAHHRGKIKHLNTSQWNTAHRTPLCLLALLRLSIRLHRKRESLQVHPPLRVDNNTLCLEISSTFTLNLCYGLTNNRTH